MGNKKPRHRATKKTTANKVVAPKKPAQFSDFVDVVDYSRKSVFLIVRLRPVTGGTLPVSLGTGFLCAPYRLMTCSHVLNTVEKADKDELGIHKPGDRYLFLNISRDAENDFGFYKELELDKNLFEYPDLDLAIIHLEDTEYVDETTGKRLHDPKQFIPLSKGMAKLGSDAAVLGYPLQRLVLDTQGNPDISGIFLRVDKGIVNAGHNRFGPDCYEFTMAFNPGNSGGPIINPDTGHAIGYVKAFQPMTIKHVVDTVPKEITNSEDDTQIVSAVKTIYSIGYSTTNLEQVAIDNQIDLF